MTGYILKKQCGTKEIDITIDRPIFQDIKTKKHHIFCNGCWDCACLKEVDISYGIDNDRANLTSHNNGSAAQSAILGVYNGTKDLQKALLMR